MKYENLEKAARRLGLGILFGFSGYGKAYRTYLLIVGLGTAATMTINYWGMPTDWLGCGAGINGPLHYICRYRHWFVPGMVGMLFGGVIVALSSLVVGIPKVVSLLKYQRAFESVGLKNSLGHFPLAIDLKAKKDRSRWLTIKTNGIGIDRFKDKARDLESALGLGVDTVESGPNPSIIRISLFGSILPKLCDYAKLKDTLAAPYSFLVGKSARETMVQSISSLPHMIIAGTTGGGKSVFFKQTLVGLLSSSPRIQMYLFDLKGGVEMNVFSMLPNVQVYKNATEAVLALKALNDEMDRRLAYLTSKGHTKVDFERDSLDMIVVGVDEASELYGKSSNKAEQSTIEQAREFTDRLTKLARATGIHVILATQKVLKETIDTKIQENIGGRMIFRMNTLQGSMTVLGNKMALELPDIPGRAIWSNGNRFIEVQAPFLSDDDLKRSLRDIKEQFDENERENFSKTLCPVVTTEIEGSETIASG